MQIISIMNCKGGVAKTTSAICLASYLSEKGYKTLLLDLDPQSNATTALMKLGIGERPEGNSLYNVFHDMILDKKSDAILNALHEVDENLSLVPASGKLEPLKDFVKSNERNSLKLMNKVLKPVKDQFDFVVMDCPPDISVYVESAIFVSDFILLPTTYNIFGFEGVAQVISAINDIHEEEYDNYRVLYTMVNPSATRIKSDLSEYEEMLDDLEVVLPFSIPTDQKIQNSQARGHDLMKDKEYKNSRARLKYTDLGEYILENLSNG